MNYVTSTDYEKLWSLVQDGKEIICWADYEVSDEEILKDICIAQVFKKYITITPHFFINNCAENKKYFIEKCKDKNVEFLPPDEWIKIEKREDVPVNEKLLFYDRQNKRIVEGRSDSFWVFSSGSCKSVEMYSHYKPLPEAPEGGVSP